MIAAIRSGGTLRQVAAQYGVSSSFVYGIVRKEGIQLRPTITEAQRRAIIEEAGNGSTIISLMRKYRIGYHRIRTIIDRSRTQPLKDSSRRLLEVLSLLQNTTLTFEQVGRRVGTSGQRIHQIYTAAVVAGIRFENRGR
jgi:Mor family transcriptional regulator